MISRRSGWLGLAVAALVPCAALLGEKSIIGVLAAKRYGVDPAIDSASLCELQLWPR